MSNEGKNLYYQISQRDGDRRVTAQQFYPYVVYDTVPGSLQIATSPLPRATEVEHYLRLLKKLAPVEYKP